jgi:hypothetical protein
MVLIRDGGGCPCDVSVTRAMHMIALAHAVVCRRRWLNNNQISTIGNGAFAGLTALTQLYDTAVGLCLLLAAWCSHGFGLISGLLLETLTFLSYSLVPFPDMLTHMGPSLYPFFYSNLLVCVCVCVCMCVCVCVCVVDIMSWGD